MTVKNLKSYFLTLLIIGSCVGLVVFNHYLAKQVQEQDEFASYWVAAKSWIEEGILPYDNQVKIKTISLLNEKNYVDPLDYTQGFFEPIINLLIYLPFGFMPYDLARSLWQLILEMTIVASIVVSLQLSGWRIHWIELLIFIVVGLISYPSIKTILFGDSAILYIFAVLLASILSVKQNGTAAGFLLAFAFTGNEVSFLPAIFLIIWRLSQRDVSTLVAYLVGISFQFLVSWILFPGWFEEWIGVLLQLFQQKNFLATPLMRISELFTGAELPLSIILHVLIFLIILLEWFGTLGKTGRIISWKIAIVLVLVYFLNIQSQAIYLFFLTPAIFLIMRFFSERWKIFGKMFNWFLIIGLNILIYYVFRIKGSWNLVEPSLILLLVPVIVWVGMNWIRWWAVQKPDPYFK